MSKIIEAGTCSYCGAAIDMVYSDSSWISQSDCSQCGTKVELHYDEYSLANAKVVRGYGVVFIAHLNGETDTEVFQDPPTRTEIEILLEQLRDGSADVNNSYVSYQADEAWVREYANGELIDMIDS